MLLFLLLACSDGYSVRKMETDPVARTCEFTLAFEEGETYAGTQTFRVSPLGKGEDVPLFANLGHDLRVECTAFFSKVQ